MGLRNVPQVPSRTLCFVTTLAFVLTMAATAAAAPTPPAARTQASPADQLRGLIQSVDAAVASGGIDSATLGTQLKAHLQTAADAAASDKKGAAGVALTAFIKDVNTQVKHIKTETASNLAETAESIKNTILGTPPFHAPAGVSSVSSASIVRPADVSVAVGTDCAAPLATVALGDTVDIQIYLTSGDADETGEGEGVVVVVPGLPPTNFNSWGGFSSYTATAKSAGAITACVQYPNDELIADDAATLVIHINSPLIRPLSPTTKTLLKGYAGYQASQALTLKVAAKFVVGPQPEAGLALEVGSYVATGVAITANLIALDPSDPNYTVIAQPTFPTLSQQPLVAHGSLTPQEAAAFNALWTNEEKIMGYGNAVLTAVNRAQGAHDANDLTNQNKQLQAAQQFAGQMGTAINAEPGLYANLKSALQASGASVQTASVSATFTEADVIDLESSIASNGLSAEMAQGLTQLGISPADQRLIAMQLITADAAAVAALGGGVFPESLTDPAFVAAQQQTGAALIQFATNPITLTPPTNPPTAAITSNLQFYPLPTPVRLLDTRAGQSGCYKPGVPLGVKTPLALNVRIVCTGLPNDALAIVGNATVVNTANAPAGFVTLYPSGANLPTASNLNFVPGDVVPNAFTVGLGSDGKFNVYATSAINFVVDITGYYAPPGNGGLYFHPLDAPIRLLDTRVGQNACIKPGKALTPGVALNLVLDSDCVSVPRGAIAVVGNATVVNSTTRAPAGFATLYPGGASLPLASNLNYVPGQVAPNAFTVGLGNNASFNLYATTGVDFVIDITGYYGVNGFNGFTYTSLAAPVRLVDTRAGQSACNAPGKPLTANTPLTLNTRTTCTGVPAAASAFIGNGTVINSAAGAPGFVDLLPEWRSTRPLPRT